jgi:hypothetical protein
MGIDFEPDRDRYRVRWREGGRRRSRRFKTKTEAEAFLASIAAGIARPEPDAPLERGRDGVYPYRTAAGIRWRFVFRQSDGSLTTRRGFVSRPAAVTARRAAMEGVRRGEIRVARERFAEFWQDTLQAKRPYVTASTLQDYVTHGRKRLLPWFGDLRLAAIDEDRVREWIADMAELVEAGELNAKTVNDARTCLSMTLGEAVRRGKLPFNPCRYVRELPVDRLEIDFLRMDEIDRYLDACASHYRPLAECRDRRADLRGARGAMERSRPRRRQRANCPPTRPPRSHHRCNQGQAVSLRPGRAATRRLATQPPGVAHGPGTRTAAGCSSALPHDAAAPPIERSPCRRAARPHTNGTKQHSRTPACATGRCTRCDTPQR